MNQTQSILYGTARGYDDWTGEPATDQSAALLRAADYIAAHYRLRAITEPADQARYDAAQFLIARDLLTNDAPLAARAGAALVKQSTELAGLKKSVEYAPAPQDPYPQATALLAPLALNTGPAGHAVGRLVRR